MAKHKIRDLLSSANSALLRKRTVAMVYVLLRFLVIIIAVAQFFNGNYENVFLCGLTLILFLLPTIFERALKIDLPNTMEIIILLFIFAAEILGEIQSFYTTFRGWDTILHSPAFMAIVAFCFSMTIGVLWEFFECAMDQFFLLDMQKDAVIHSISSVMLDPTGGNTPTIIRDIADVIVVTGSGEEISLGLGGYLDVGILDTMKDLFVNFIGAVVFSFIGYFYVKSRGKGRFARRFIPQVVDIQPEDQEPWTPKLLKKSKKNRSDKE